MGVAIESKHHTIHLGYGGFNSLRTKVAELVGTEIYEHYKNVTKGMFLSAEESKKFYSEYNQKTSEIEEKCKIPKAIMDFLYQPDCDGYLTYRDCKQLWKIIEDYDDDVKYGYYGRDDCTMFKDFKSVIQDCVDNKCRLVWY